MSITGVARGLVTLLVLGVLCIIIQARIEGRYNSCLDITISVFSPIGPQSHINDRISGTSHPKETRCYNVTIIFESPECVLCSFMTIKKTFKNQRTTGKNYNNSDINSQQWT